MGAKSKKKKQNNEETIPYEMYLEQEPIFNILLARIVVFWVSMLMVLRNDNSSVTFFNSFLILMFSQLMFSFSIKAKALFSLRVKRICYLGSIFSIFVGVLGTFGILEIIPIDDLYFLTFKYHQFTYPIIQSLNFILIVGAFFTTIYIIEIVARGIRSDKEA